jgi:hypothetical protein
MPALIRFGTATAFRGRAAARSLAGAARRHVVVSGVAGALIAGIVAGGVGFAVARPPAASTQSAALTARPLAAGSATAARHPLRRAAALRAIIGLVATDTHQTRAQVLAQLRAGKSLDQIAGSQAAAVRQQVIDRLTTRLNTAVAAKRITQAEATRRLAAWKTALATLMARPGTSLGHGPFRGARPGASASPSASA